MGEMRYGEKLRAQNLTDFSYTWDAIYNKLLFRDDLNANTRVTVSTTLPNDASQNTDKTTSTYWLLPRKYRGRVIFDGYARGNVKVEAYSAYADTSWSSQQVRANISLLARTSGGVDRTLGTASTANINAHCTAPNSALDITADIPFFMLLTRAELLETELLVLQIDYITQWSEGVAGATVWAKYHSALNQDDLFIELPMLP